MSFKNKIKKKLYKYKLLLVAQQLVWCYAPTMCYVRFWCVSFYPCCDLRFYHLATHYICRILRSLL